MRNAILLVLLIFLSACSGKPSNAELERQLWASLEADGVGEIFSLTDFEKLNGYEKSDRIYIADVRYQLTFRKDLEAWAEEIKQSSEDKPFEAFGAGMGLVALQLRYGNFKAGDTISQADKITYIKTEKGWRVED